MSESVVTIGFSSPGTCDHLGMPLRQHGCLDTRQKLPTRPLKISKIIELLENSLTTLEDTNCTFWACQGPRRPRHMITCSRCWGIRDLQRSIRHLKAHALQEQICKQS